jgi:hypothetical protein
VSRWLLPILAVLSLLGSSVTSWAAAGLIGDTDCCCPVKAKCKCHDHGKQPSTEAKIKRCGDIVKLVAPLQIVALAPTVAPTTTEPRVTWLEPPALAQMPDDWTAPPDRPPI